MPPSTGSEPASGPEGAEATPRLRAALLSIGDELVLGESLDTNSAWLSRALAARGVLVDEHRTVGDDRAAIADAFRVLARGRVAVIATGGLGPTADDLTREGLADAVAGGELVEDETARRHLEAWFAGRGRSMPASNLRQVRRPATARMLENPHGTAGGLEAPVDGSEDAGATRCWALPGPPREMQPMFDRFVDPWLAGVAGDRAVHTILVHAYGIGESAAAERLGELLERDRDPVVGITAGHAIITARIRAVGPAGEVPGPVLDLAGEIERRLAPFAFGRGEATLAAAVLERLRPGGHTLATVESCTGGLVGAMLTAVAGSSDVFLGGWVTYANAMKIAEVGVDPRLIEDLGAVSTEVAEAMARGGLERSGADRALAITGVAGPGGSESKPAGLVHVAVAARRPGAVEVHVRGFRFTGDRDAVRDRSAKTALQMVRLLEDGALDGQRLLWEVEGS